jgi:hypothetical protein
MPPNPQENGMYRFVLALVFSLAAVAALPSPAVAQAGARAYAPERLWELSVPDQRRVIALEYEEQSNGRRIPDDQMRFYLDQVRQSRWTFSRVKSDIAQSLRGNPGGNQGGNPGGNWGGNNGRVYCESVKDRYNECTTNFRGRAYVVRKFSRAECVEGRSWGQMRGRVWVNHGCRAEFAERTGGGRPDQGYSVTCSSNSERYTTCAWNSRQGRPVLVEKLSRHRCDEGRDWGYRDGAIWVDNGCRARFAPRR